MVEESIFTCYRGTQGQVDKRSPSSGHIHELLYRITAVLGFFFLLPLPPHPVMQLCLVTDFFKKHMPVSCLHIQSV